MLDLIERYRQEKRAWKKAGKPIRPIKRMKEIHAICSECPLFAKGEGLVPGYDRCTECGCNLHPTSKLANKIAWGTTHCPLDEPKWGPDIESEATGEPSEGDK